MNVPTALAAVDLEVGQTLNDDIAGVPAGLAGLGWTSAGVARGGVLPDCRWTHAACNGMASAQTGRHGDNFYVGLIANIIGDYDHDDTDGRARSLVRQIHDRIQPRLLAHGFTLMPDDRPSSYLWSDGQRAVELSLLPRIRQTDHTVPPAVQFAAQPLENLSGWN